MTQLREYVRERHAAAAVAASRGGCGCNADGRRVSRSGLDMTDEMLALARRNAEEAGAEHELPQGPDRGGAAAGRIGRRRALELCDLSTDKPAVLAEIARVVKPGGRIGIADVVAEDRLFHDERARRGSYVGCIAGALSESEYQTGLESAGFQEISVEFTHQVADGMHSAIVKAVKPAR